MSPGQATSSTGAPRRAHHLVRTASRGVTRKGHLRLTRMPHVSGPATDSEAGNSPPVTDNHVTGGQRPRPYLHRPPVAGGGPDPGPWQERADLDVWGTPAGQQARQAPSLGDRLTRVSPARHITGCSASRKPRSLLN